MIRADLQYLLRAGQYSACLQTHQIPAGALKARGSQRSRQLSLSRPSTSPWPCLQAQAEAARPPNQGSARFAAAHALSCERTWGRLDKPAIGEHTLHGDRGWHLSWSPGPAGGAARTFEVFLGAGRRCRNHRGTHREFRKPRRTEGAGLPHAHATKLLAEGHAYN